MPNVPSGITGIDTMMSLRRCDRDLSTGDFNAEIRSCSVALRRDAPLVDKLFRCARPFSRPWVRRKLVQ